MSGALVSDLARASPHDGPGLRTVVFFKGCPLRCPWCHNPELVHPRPEIAFALARCVRCGDCAAVCPLAAIRLEAPARIDRSRCDGCGACAAACPAAALRQVGHRVEVGELLAALLRDREYYEVSGGGVTLSGGEPMLHAPFVAELLRRLTREGIHTAMETCGHFEWERFRPALESLDLVLYDVKLADPRQHERLLGVDNSTIVDNLRRLLAERPLDTVVRIPIIPRFTATEANLRGLAELLAPLRPRRVVLLPWHPLGLSKARAVGRTPVPELPEALLSRAELERWRAFLPGATLP